MCEIPESQQEVDGDDEAVIVVSLRGHHWVHRQYALTIKSKFWLVKHHLLLDVAVDIRADKEVRILLCHQLFLLLLLRSL